MVQIEIDTDKIKLAADNLIVKADELNSKIDEIFLKFANLQTTKTWIGEGELSPVKKFQDKVAKDKEQYTNYVENIRKLSNVLVDTSNKISAIADSNKI